MNKYNLNSQFEIYLTRVGLDKAKMHPNQLVEIKRAFMGAAGQLLVLFRDDIGSIPSEELAVLTMESLFTQVAEFWSKENNG